MSSRLRLGVVGAGHLGRLHARVLASLDGVELVGVVDIEPLRAREVAELYGAVALSDYRELLGKVDAITVAVPTPLHAEVGLAFLSSRTHTFIEKPLAVSVAEGRALVAEAREQGVVLAVGHSERFNPALKAARQVIANPRFVEVHRLAPFDERGTEVDVVLDLMIHDIDLVIHLIGESPRDVAAVGVAVLTDLVDIANARLTFSSGAVVNLTASRVSRDRVRKIRFFARETYVSLDTGTKRVDAVRLVRDASGKRLESFSVDVTQSEPLLDELSAFRDAALGEAPPPVTGAEALAALEVAERIRTAIARHAERAGLGA